MNRMQLKISLMAAAITFTSGLSGLSQAAPTPAAGTVDLLTTPPELTAKVAPNVVLTFDDSGSMGSQHMPDQRPYDATGWNTGSPWYCAGVIDPLAAAGTLAALPMNGVYYNPNTIYRPPLYQDGSSFPTQPSPPPGKMAFGTIARPIRAIPLRATCRHAGSAASAARATTATPARR